MEEFYPSYIQQYLVNGESPFNEVQIKFLMHSLAKALLFLKQRNIIHGVYSTLPPSQLGRQAGQFARFVHQLDRTF